MTAFDRSQVDPDRIAATAEAIERHARPLDEQTDLRPLVEAVEDARFVLLGEATHGTADFYRWRARLTAELIRDGRVSFVAVEGDWVDCYEVNRYVRGDSEYDSALDVLAAFDRWPTWMWGNWEVVEFVDWLAEYNRGRADDEQIGFYGMDVYGLFESMAAVIEYLERTDPDAAEQARDAYRCFEPYGRDASEYARSTRMIPEDCEDEVLDVLASLRGRGPPGDGEEFEDFFEAEGSALAARNAEAYYRALGRADVNSWNVRDRHMAETLDRLLAYHESDGSGVVWAHNTHVGDARATTMAERGEINVGQLVRESYGPDDVALVGFGTHRGEVIAGASWGAQMQRMPVPPAMEGSYEDALHRAGVGDCALVFDDGVRDSALADRRGHRAIGVVYDPDREAGNYVPTDLTDRYDAFVFVEETEALHPLGIEPHGLEEPDTYPWGV